jgi:hypothetical protein
MIIYLLLHVHNNYVYMHQLTYFYIRIFIGRIGVPFEDIKTAANAHSVLTLNDKDKNSFLSDIIIGQINKQDLVGIYMNIYVNICINMCLFIYTCI